MIFSGGRVERCPPPLPRALCVVCLAPAARQGGLLMRPAPIRPPGALRPEAAQRALQARLVPWRRALARLKGFRLTKAQYAAAVAALSDKVPLVGI